MGHIEEVLQNQLGTQFLKNATVLLPAALVVVITACKSKSINDLKMCKSFDGLRTHL